MTTPISEDIHVEEASYPGRMRGTRWGNRRASASVQLHHVAVREILDDLVCLAPLGAATRRRGDVRADAAPRRDYRAVLAVSSVNYTLKSEGEQEAITASYQAFLNGLAFPVQVLVRVVPLDLGPYLARLRAAGGQDEAPNVCAVNAWDESTCTPKTRLHIGSPDPETADDPGAPGAAASSEEHSSPSRAAESVWAALARDHVRFVRDLAARHTLLERRFYLVVPADGETTGGTMRSRRRGRGIHSGGTGLIGWLPGRRARVRRAAAEHLATVRQQLDLRSGELIRQLGRIGLEARRLRGAELAALFATCLSPGRAARHPLPSAVMQGAGHPTSRAFLPVVLPVPATAPAIPENPENVEGWKHT